MNRDRTLVPLLAGILVGAVLVGPCAHALGEVFKATPSVQKFYVNGQQVDMEAYAIEGYNYVKLRDIGRMVGFDVSYDYNTDSALITTGVAYVDDEAPAPVPAPQPIEAADYAAQANPAIFKGELTREAYNGIRSAMLHQGDILAGTCAPPSVGDAKAAGRADQAASSIKRYPIYEVLNASEGQGACNVRHPEAYKPAAEHTADFIASLSSLSDAEKVAQIVWYVADRISYKIEYPSPATVLTQDGSVGGCCMAYAYSFQFLCNLAEIPCILVQNPEHQWNEVYVNGSWWGVDVTSDDMGDETKYRHLVTILHPAGDFQGSMYRDGSPDVTLFTKELLVPGSTK